ncbi:hypothetical protein Cob_v009023 [Colletotrichum orbiculare MAFF 240422]|uniref:Uncharacterized protein n=1 Tax=Colletotrichum orbiculare (strain 104-T / ATCC 96160 / CBS 514.97 / LARS 414 / MAFF 240422) TaxID=1213857 RepID=A0A484FKM6_COLOR|nr:hypothetical protein Cob_v009023 [Colletotrichum orbiculare MAFF 240422]
MQLLSLLPFLIVTALAADQGRGCSALEALDCSGDNIVKCYVWPGRDKPTWNYVDSCFDRQLRCSAGTCVC